MKLYTIMLLLFGVFMEAQTVRFTTLLEDQISIRAIEIWKNKVFYVGTDSKFGYVGLINTHDKKQIRLSAQKR